MSPSWKRQKQMIADPEFRLIHDVGSPADYRQPACDAQLRGFLPQQATA